MILNFSLKAADHMKLLDVLMIVNVNIKFLINYVGGTVFYITLIEGL
jgi:hypothetical protein